MKYQLIKKDAYKTSRWTGGETREMAIWPAGSQYLERNFIWRLSSATVEQEESDFSSLPDYDRVLMVLDGEVVLSHEGQRVARLKALEQDRFDGAYKTHSFGKITDYNLMVRKGNEGYLDLLYPEETAAACGPTYPTEKPLAAHALFCQEGYFVANFSGQTVMASPGELLVMEFGEGEQPAYTIMGEGTVIRAQVYFDEMKGQLAAEEIPSEKATFDDFKACVYLANVQFRAAKYILPSLKRTWFDQALS
ncbi:MAG: HutD family protein, partial [Anaerovoracaceae bacterium]